MVLTNDDDTVGYLTNELQFLFGVEIIRTLPAGMDNVPMFRNIMENELSRKEAKRLAKLALASLCQIAYGYLAPFVSLATTPNLIRIISSPMSK
ncbi:hypothetical protein F2Q70_00014018 [Brassica cretica]|uniref:Uncharacterized protein n=1 Tax=Brassica cretica TaxID=69181 RepID=A0A8S9HY01_BRACR|nr:hypothetical protein F2Q70_00014018 [Brassica cretica]KAF2601002.1 hypothetical protein F2Q68_00007051 [Brassica cretica]